MPDPHFINQEPHETTSILIDVDERTYLSTVWRFRMRDGNDRAEFMATMWRRITDPEETWQYRARLRFDALTPDPLDDRKLDDRKVSFARVVRGAERDVRSFISENILEIREGMGTHGIESDRLELDVVERKGDAVSDWYMRQSWIHVVPEPHAKA